MAISWGNYTKLLLHMNGSNNSTTFTDSSLYAKTITANGNAKISTSQSKWGGSSGYFDGQDSPSTYLSIADDADWDFNGTSYSIEFWIYITALKATDYWIFQQGNGTGAACPVRIDLLSTGVINCQGSANNSSWTFTTGLATAALSTGTWYHVALCDDGTNCRLFLDGVQSASRATWAKTNSSNSVLIGGGYSSGDREFNGYLQDFRIVKGFTLFATSFTPPAEIFPDPLWPEPITKTGFALDAQDGGIYRIIGTITELGVVGSYRVRLFDRESGRVIRQTWSAADGSYSFTDLAYRANGYFAVAYDHGGSPLNAAIADLITPELMP